MKILCIIDSLGSGGAQRQLVNLALVFKEWGHKVSFLVYHRENFYKEVLDLNYIIVNEIIEPNYIRRLFKMRKFIRTGSFDAVLSFLEASNFICEFAGFPFRKWKLIVGERSANPNIFKSPKLRLYRWFHFFANYVVANSYENLRMVRKINPLLPLKKCKVIYNIVDFEKWKPAIEHKFRENGKLNITVVASHQYLKNLNGLVEAIALLDEDEKKQLRVNWYGGSRNDDSKEKAIKKIEEYKLNNIFSFYEPSHEIVTKVHSADILGLFSFYEGLPNVICEAMAARKTVIASNVSDIPHLIDNTNLLFNPYSSKDISKVLKYILSLSSLENKTISDRNYSFARETFDKDKITNEYIDLFQ